uniref:Retrovirus-related Pol polyprotein from transposon TNT 1-94 n=1 Tax=Tanacetum cinerariifolium TaxID=118510 RepID=A0A699H484_TANCI|nr:retrovirus-related Pol polyprotein from transposon TNT 1-94 [Tanacetum cinerariifolium]GEW98200.1 retrovirus-related Pol polyprotein from transposon TNT 1-94 [Tanacetum cinerariifolium]
MALRLYMCFTSHSSQAQGSSSYTDELMFLFFDNQSSTSQLDKEDLEKINQDDLEEMDLNGRSTRNSGNMSSDAGNARYRGRVSGKRPAKEEDAQALLDEALKEKEDLKAKFEKFETSSKNLTKLLDSQISAKVKTSRGYDSQFNEKEVLDIKEEEVIKTVFDNRSSDEENNVANDRFQKGKGYHVVPSPLTRNYMPPKHDLTFAGLNDSIYQFKISKAVISLAKDEKDAPETSIACVEKPKEDRSSAALIEDLETDSDDDNIFTPESIPAEIDFMKAGESVKDVKPIEYVKHVKSTTPVKTSKQTKKSKNFSSSLKVDRKSWNGKMTQKLGLSFGFTKKACFVCGSLSHLIKDCTFHEDRMDKKSVLPTNVGKGIGHTESRPGHPQQALKNNKIVDSGCSRHMQGTKSILLIIKRFMMEVLFLLAQVEDMMLGYVNFQTIHKLVRGNLVKGLPSKIFNNDHSCAACQKGKQHKATCKAKLVSSIIQPLQMLHMDLFGLTSIMSINHKKCCLVVTDDFSRFSWVFFLATKDETSKVFKPFITTIENQINKKVKVITCDNGTKFKNRNLDEFCGMKGIKKEYRNARTPQQKEVIERKNMTLIEEARTMLADSLLPITFWAEAVNTACYVLNRALVTKTQNKTPYELLNGRAPRLDFMRPFGCHDTILNTLDPLGKFEGKAGEGFLVGYSVTSKAFRVFNTKTIKVKENLHVRFLENKPNVAETRLNWCFDIDSLTNSMNYIPVSAGNQTDKNAGTQDTNGNAGTQDTIDAGKEVSDQQYIVLPLWSSISSIYQSLDDKLKDDIEKEASDAANALRKEFEQGCMDQRGVTQAGSTNSFNTVSNPVNAASTSETFSAGRLSSPHPDAFIPVNTLLHVDQDNSQIHDLEETA